MSFSLGYLCILGCEPGPKRLNHFSSPYLHIFKHNFMTFPKWVRKQLSGQDKGLEAQWPPHSHKRALVLPG